MKTEDYGQYAQPNEIRFMRLLPGPIERIWAYITEPEKRATWFARGEMELKVGGRVDFAFTHGDFDSGETRPEKWKCAGNEGVRGTVLAVEAPRLITFTFPCDDGDEGDVTIELTERGKEVQLVLTHRRIINRDSTLGVSSGWHAHLDILVAQVAGQPLPLFWSKMQGLESHYSEKHAKQFPA